MTEPSNSIVKKTASSILSRKAAAGGSMFGLLPTVIVGGLFGGGGKNNSPPPPPTTTRPLLSNRRDKRDKYNNDNKKKDNKNKTVESNKHVQQQIQSSPSQLPSSSSNQHSLLLWYYWSKRFVGYGMATVYIIYPISLLLMFRISEQMSLYRVFEYLHACLSAADNSGNSCFKLHFFETLLVVWTIGISAITIYIPKNLQQRITFVCVVSILAISLFKGCVDHWLLYDLPRNEVSTTNLSGKVAVVTGGNRGIGYAIAKELVKLGANVIITCRTLEKCQVAVNQIHEEVIIASSSKDGAAGGAIVGSASAAVLNLGDLQSAYDLSQQLVEQYSSTTNGGSGIHYVICNAGTTPTYPLTQDGLEDGFGGMHLTHMALVLGLLPVMSKSKEVEQERVDVDDRRRIVMVSSEMALNSAMGLFGGTTTFPGITVEEFNTDLRGEKTRGDGTIMNSLPAYGRAKLCNVLFAIELNRILKEGRNFSSITVNAIHSGAVSTKTSRDSIKGIFKNIPGLSYIVSNIYFPLLWRTTHGGARILLCSLLATKPEALVYGGQYLDAMCHPLIPLHEKLKKTKKTPLSSPPSSITTSREDSMITIPSWIMGKKGDGDDDGTISLYKDPIQALIDADTKWSKPLWDVSISLIEQSPASNVVKNLNFMMEDETSYGSE